MRLGANGCPFTMEPRILQTWKRIQNDPDPIIQRHWARLDPHYKYALTQDPQHIPANIVPYLTTIEYVPQPDNTFIGKPFCGTLPYVAEAVAGGLEVNFSRSTSLPTDIKDILDLVDMGKKIKIENAEYTILNAMNELIVEGMTQGGFYNLNDTNVDFIAKGVKAGDLLVYKNSTRMYSIDAVFKHQLYANNDRTDGGTVYQIRRLTFKIDYNLTDGIYNFQPHDKIFYRPEGCTTSAGNDNIRGNFGLGVVRYMIFYDVISNEDRLKINDVYFNICQQILHRRAIDVSDYDNFNLGWTAITIFSLVIKDDFPELYAKIVNDEAYKSWAPRIANYIDNEMGGDAPDMMAMFINGTNYDPATLRAIIQHQTWITWWTGIAPFSGFDRKMKKIGEALKAYFIPTFQETFQWSDNQEFFTNYNYLTGDNLATIGYLANDPELWWMWDQVWANSPYRVFDSPHSNYSPFADPYAPRSPITRVNDHHNDSVRGVSMMKTSWDKSAFVACSLLWGNPGTDHNPDGTDFMLWGDGERLIWPELGYIGSNYITHMNGFIPFSTFALMNRQVQREYQCGDGWFYTCGVKQDKMSYHDSNYYDINGGGGNVLWQQEEKFFIHLKGHFFIVVRNLLRTSSEIVNLQNMKNEGTRKRLEASGGKHCWNFGVPKGFRAPGVMNDWRWGNNTKVRLTSLAKGYTANIYDPSEHAGHQTYPWFDGMSTPSTCDFLRIEPKEILGENSWIHVFHAKKDGFPDATYKETAEGIKINISGDELDLVFSPFIPSYIINGIIQAPDIRKVTTPNYPIEPPPIPDPLPTPAPGPQPQPVPSPGGPMITGQITNVRGTTIFGTVFSSDPAQTWPIGIKLFVEGTGNLYETTTGEFGSFQITLPAQWIDGRGHLVVIYANDVNIVNIPSLEFKPIPEPTPESEPVPAPLPTPQPTPVPQINDLIITIKTGTKINITRRKKPTQTVVLTIDPALKITVNGEPKE